MTGRIKYKILHASSEDPEHPVSELLFHSSKTKGWSSSRFCDYPQELVLVFEGPVTARQIQFLSHQCRIASKIELYVHEESKDERTDHIIRKYFAEDDVESRGALQYYYEQHRSQFKRLGYLSLDSNERSQFQARELKSVYIDHKARFLRLRLHKCHLNKFNLTNQVSLVAINVLGENLPMPEPTSNFSSGTGAQVPPLASSFQKPLVEPGIMQASSSSSKAPDNYDPKIAEKLNALGKAKDHAVEIEDYQEAKRYKEMITKLKAVAMRITECERKKKQAVDAEDYDAAKRLKAEIDALYRAAIEGRDPNQDREQPPEMEMHDEVDHHPPRAVGGHGAGGGGPAPIYTNYDEVSSASRGPASQRGTMNKVTNSPPIRPRDGSRSQVSAAPTSPLLPAVNNEEVPVGNTSYNAGYRTRNNQGGGGGEQQPLGGLSTYSRGGYEPDSPGTTEPQQQHVAKKSYPSLSNLGPDSDPNSIKGMHLFADLGAAPDPPDHLPPLGTTEGGLPPGAEELKPNAELPDPEPISSSFTKEVQPLLHVTGDEHLVSCLYSKQRVLREHGLTRLTDDLNGGVYDTLLEDAASSKEFLQGLVALLRRTSIEKNVQIFLSSMQLAQTLCTKVILANEDKGFSLKKADAQPQLDSYIPMLVERLGETNARCAQAAGDAVLSFALCPNVGCTFVAQFLMKPIVSKSKKVFPQKVYCNRIKLLTILMQESSGESIHEQLLSVAMGWFDNPNHEVRQSIVELVGVIYGKTASYSVVEPYLADLRPAQREVFEAEFERVGGEDFLLEKKASQLLHAAQQEQQTTVPASSSSSSTSGPSKQQPKKKAKKPVPGAGGGTTTGGVAAGAVGAGATGASSSAPAEQPAASAADGGGPVELVEDGPSVYEPPPSGDANEEQHIISKEVNLEGAHAEVDEFECQFCHLKDPSFTPEVLDLHYWKDCPLLMECRFCQQVIEISSLRSHFLEECEHFPMSEIYEQTPDGAPPVLPPPGACPLCLEPVQEDEWKDHLLACEKNPRKFGTISAA
ncbi:unnamed protein product [Amoebophrya sp. A120]|nr:unnamed protein product [Amoebophrya sp. A120]|eukprot:GSA120T00021705001.1